MSSSSIPPVAPALPPAQIVNLAGRGELFVRRDLERSATTVVLLHGWTADADTNFHGVFPALDGYRVIAPDLRGHGRSLFPETPFAIADAADDIAALLDELAIERAIVAGYSLGGAVAQMLADRRPDLVAGLVLAATDLATRRKVARAVGARIEAWALSMRRLTRGRWMAHQLVDRAARSNADIEPLRGWLVSAFERGHPATLRDAGRAMARFDASDIAARRAASIPAAVVVTERDRLIRPADQRALAAAWEARCFAVPADHDAPIAAPSELADTLRRAIAHVEDVGRVSERVA